MLPGSVDPRRPEKQQRYKPPPANNNAAPGEDLTPDYMNILDPQRKSMQTRSDRFKVVKIESTEPFRRGRWECMDFLDQSYNRVYQRNCNYARQVSSDTHTQTVSPNSHSNNSDLQSSMLQIFYRQNTTENNAIVFSLQHQINNKEYQNHVLRPGMVSSSLVGIKYPFELNFEDDSSPSKDNCCKNRPSTVDCHEHCDNQKFQSMSSDFTVYQNLNQDLSNNGQYIDNRTQPTINYSDVYQEQLITYVDNYLPQQRNNNEVYTTNEFDKINYNEQQFTQIIETPIMNDAPQILYHPNPRFQEDDQYLPRTESQNQNILHQNDQLNSVISTSSYQNINNEIYTQNDFKTETNTPGQEEKISYPESPSLMPIYAPNTSSKSPDVKNLVLCSNQNRNHQSIDDKIEQLMDLVKKHLKYAVLEDVNVMKQQILILKGRVAQLEYENALLKSCEDRSKRRNDI